MTIALEIPPRPKISTKDEVQWDAVVARDRKYDGKFYYSVTTTGVYCRPSCPSRLAKRVNVRFHDTRAEAEAAGFRPCKRCGPDQSALEEQHSVNVHWVRSWLPRAITVSAPYRSATNRTPLCAICKTNFLGRS